MLLANWALGAVGKGISIPAPREGSVASYHETLALVDAIKGGRVGVLLVHGANPVYSLPASSGFAEALAKVPFVVSLASLPDETSERANLVLPDHSPLESWGDAEPRPGIRSLVQPTLRPLYDTRALVDALFDVARAMGPEVAAKLPADSFRTLVEQSFAGTDFYAALAKGGVFAPQPGLEVALVPSAVDFELAEPALEGEGEFTLAHRRRARCSTTVAVRTWRGCRKYRIPSPRSPGSRSPSCRRARPRNSAASSSAT